MKRLAVAMLAIAGLLAGCGEPALPQPSPRPTSETVPVLSSAQVDAALKQITETVTKADETRDAALLGTVAEGPALTMRTAAYSMLAKNPQLPLLSPIGAERLQDAVPTDQAWPRTVLVVTRVNDQDTLPKLLVLTQHSPRDQYKLNAAVAMIGGAQLPLTNTIRDGVAVRRVGDAADLTLSARAALDLYASVLTQGTTAPDAAKIAPSPLTDRIAQANGQTVNLLTVACPGCFTVTTSYSAPGTMWAFETADGGSLVVGEIIQETKIVSQNGYQTDLSPEVQALTGVQKITKESSETRVIMVGLSVPPSGADQAVQVVAGEERLTAATAS